MKQRIRAFSRRSVVMFFSGIYVLAALFAVFPPLYLWGSGSRFPLLGVPFATMYWLINSLVLGLALTAFYIVEVIRGELDDESTAATTKRSGD